MSAGVVYDCPHAEVCKTCPCSHEDDACFPGERLRAELARARARIEELEAENRRLRELYANQAGLAKRGWSIDHLMECEEALRMAEGAHEAAEVRCASIRAEIVAAVRESPRLPMVVAEYAPAVADFIEREFPAPVQADTEETSG